MKNLDRLSRVRQEIHQAREARERLEMVVLEMGPVLQGSLIKRHLGTATERRKAPAYYLSRAEGGRTRLVYIPRDRVEAVRRATEAWRHFKSTLRQWEKIHDRIARLLRQVGRLRQERGDGTRSHPAGTS
jgi:hypothetical protein